MKNSSPTTILIIDDDPVARMLSKRNLEIAGFKGKIATAENGEIGINILMSTPNERFAIILDYHMPILDGLGFLKRMVNEKISFPVFMLSSSIMKGHKDECLAYVNVQDYFIKPIDQEKSKMVFNTYDFVKLS